MHTSNERREIFQEVADTLSRIGKPITLDTKVVDLSSYAEECGDYDYMDVRTLIGKMWHVTDIMPWLTCEAIDDCCPYGYSVPQGSTYAKGARTLRNII